MSVVAQIIVGAFAGWLTGKAIAAEGYEQPAKGRSGSISDAFYGIVGAMVGEYLFFWIVVGADSTFSRYATTVLGAIAIVGAARLIAGKIYSHRPARFLN